MRIVNELVDIPYRRFAYAYDRMMSNVDYDRWVRYMVELFEYYGPMPRRVLDLACGTGSIAIPLAQRGFQVTGIDRAPEMLEVAEKKAKRAGVSVEWRVGDMRNFTVEDPFDAVLCLYDSINYALTREELEAVFESVHRALVPGGLWIFDVTTEHNIVEHFHGETFSENHPDFTYIWKNVYLRTEKICRTELTFFLRNESGSFDRYIELHLQKIFEVGEIKRSLDRTGFHLLSAFDAWTFSKHRRDSDRINFTARRRED
ncbi:MAG: methyltransferase [Candidatus Poribacteria bacterium]|nr:MAG: methyltransferase [Candidatus Poribacteria bacterium]